MPFPVTPSQVKSAIVSVAGSFCDAFRRGFALPGLAADWVAYWMNATGTGFTDAFKADLPLVDCSVFDPPDDPDPDRECNAEPVVLNWARVDSLNIADWGEFGATCAALTQTLSSAVPGTIGQNYQALVRVRGVFELKTLDSAFTYTGPFSAESGATFNSSMYNEIRLNTPGLGPVNYLLNVAAPAVGYGSYAPQSVDYCMSIPVVGGEQYLLIYESGPTGTGNDELQLRNFQGILSPIPDVNGNFPMLLGQHIQLDIVSLNEI